MVLAYGLNRQAERRKLALRSDMTVFSRQLANRQPNRREPLHDWIAVKLRFSEWLLKAIPLAGKRAKFDHLSHRIEEIIDADIG